MTTQASELATTYRPAEVEPEVIERWEAAGAGHGDPAAPGEPYSILIPPPNVTAALHLGHALNNTLQDVLVRFHRMQGRNAMWMPGTDHAGIATQTVVEKRVLQEEGKRRTDFEREQFVEKVQAWKDEYEQRITDQLKRMGCSCDWPRQRFTMDDVCAAAVREAFFRLFRDGLIYRGKRLVNWDPLTQTALADDEVEMKEVDGHFWYMKYPLVDDAGRDTGEHVTVATTRPETMLGDTAVAVNPNDTERAGHIGRKVRLPIVNRIIPIVGDEHVTMPDPEGDERARYSSGYLKVTPAHDPNDYEIGFRHERGITEVAGCVLINVMAPDATISAEHGWPADDFERGDDVLKSELIGLSREAARKRILKWFRENELLADEKPYRHSVGHSYRSHVPIEPYLSDQWYIAVTRQIPHMPDEGNVPGTEVPANSLAGLALRAMANDQSEITQTAPSRDREGAVSPESAPHPHTQIIIRRGYLITFTTYGTWLHGDDRGSADREHNLPGTPYLVGDEIREKAEFAQLKHEPASLNEAARTIVQDAIIEVCANRGWVLHAVHVRPQHVHVVLEADVVPERAMNDFKAYATRRLREHDRIGRDERVWTRHGSTRHLDDDAAVHAAVGYVVEQQGESLHPGPFDARQESDQPLPYGRGSAPSEARTQLREWEGHLRFYPSRYAKTFETWHANIRDWCISRQLWWGHRIPVWTFELSDLFKQSAGVVDTRHARPDEDFQFQFTDEDNRAIRAIQSLKQAHPESIHVSGFWLSDVIEGDLVTDGFAVDSTISVCIRSDESQIAEQLEQAGFTQDPDVLDTWFSSGLWPLSTMGWPDPQRFPGQIPEGEQVLRTWNPTNVLCTAREIITLWVSRMVMFNLYFTDPACDSQSWEQRLPFYDVFVHAMIQDGHGQKMSKSLGNGVDPMDIIHSHGADAMRFTLTNMTTHTQDVRMPVELICPYTDETFQPQYITSPGGYRVMAPTQTCPSDKSKKMATSYGISSGEVREDELPVARNTSSKFDQGRNFANKIWNAVRFALGNLEQADRPAFDAPQLTLPDRWLLSRLAGITHELPPLLARYEFSPYTQRLYDFFWRDVCDWYIEAVKPSVQGNATQRAVLAAAIDASVRMLHPVMPFITEKLFAQLNAVLPGDRGFEGVALAPAEVLASAGWPRVERTWADGEADAAFELVQGVVTAVRQVRTQQQVPPRQMVDLSADAPPAIAQQLLERSDLIATLANVQCREIGPRVEKPADAAVAVTAELELYLHGLIEPAKERDRLSKRLEELDRQIKTLEGRLANENYVNKAPAHLVEQTREQLAAAQRERENIQTQLAGL